MDDLVDQLEDIPLNGCDLSNMVSKMGNKNTRYLMYSDLKDIHSVDQLFNGVNSVFILLSVKSDDGMEHPIGHWVVLCLTNGKISYFDPYGLSLKKDIALSGEPPYLLDLLRGHRVNENKHRYQKELEDVNTCGRHCTVRALFHFLTNEEYYKRVVAPIVKHRLVYDSDVFACLMTAFLGCENSDDIVLNFFKN